MQPRGTRQPPLTPDLSLMLTGLRARDPVSTVPTWTTIYVQLFMPALALCVCAAWVLGGKPERLAAAAYVLAAALELFLRRPLATRFWTVEAASAGVDLCLLIVLALLAGRYRRSWLVCAAAIQLVSASGHIAKFLMPTLSRLAYELMIGSGGYPQLILLLFGSASHAWMMRRTSMRQHRADAAGTSDGF